MLVFTHGICNCDIISRNLLSFINCPFLNDIYISIGVFVFYLMMTNPKVIAEKRTVLLKQKFCTNRLSTSLYINFTKIENIEIKFLSFIVRSHKHYIVSTKIIRKKYIL